MTVEVTSLYLSRLILNPRSRQVWSELAQPYEMHRTLMQAYKHHPLEQGENAREKFDVLFRADEDEWRRRVIVYVQSTVEPDWSCLETRHDYLLADADPPNPACRDDIMAALQRLQRGQVFTFRLRANPTKRIAKPVNGNIELKGKRVGLLREKEQIDWLIRKGQEREKSKPGGFEILMREGEDENGNIAPIPHVSVCCEGKRRNRKKEKENGRSHETTHLAVRFDGHLRVTDPNAFYETIVRGIGGAKAYGFGLLSIGPVKDN